VVRCDQLQLVITKAGLNLTQPSHRFVRFGNQHGPATRAFSKADHPTDHGRGSGVRLGACDQVLVSFAMLAGHSNELAMIRAAAHRAVGDGRPRHGVQLRVASYRRRSPPGLTSCLHRPQTKRLCAVWIARPSAQVFNHGNLALSDPLT